MPRLRTRLLAAAILVAALLALFGWILNRPAAPLNQPIGLFTSLPLVWGEGDDLGNLLPGAQPPHRVRTALAKLGPLQPLDTLESLGPALHRLVIAQPRPLSPAENIALDNWLRAGGRLLLLADPLLTEPSVYPLGDPRRPQDLVLLSPILQRWGLELTFDEQQPAGVRVIAVAGPAVPVNLAGAWRTSGGQCRSEGDGLLVTCQVGQGRVIALADAEVLAAQDPDLLRQPALASLLDRAFSTP